MSIAKHAGQVYGPSSTLTVKYPTILKKGFIWSGVDRATLGEADDGRLVRCCNGSGDSSIPAGHCAEQGETRWATNHPQYPNCSPPYANGSDLTGKRAKKLSVTTNLNRQFQLDAAQAIAPGIERRSKRTVCQRTCGRNTEKPVNSRIPRCIGRRIASRSPLKPSGVSAGSARSKISIGISGNVRTLVIPQHRPVARVVPDRCPPVPEEVRRVICAIFRPHLHTRSGR